MADFLLNDPWRRAAVIGIGIKAFLHIRLFDIPIPGAKPFPFGVETLTRFFEPWLLRSIELDYWLALTRFLAPARTKYTDLATTRQIALSGVPGNFDPTTKGAMVTDINGASTAFDVLLVYLTNTGRAVFLATFP